MTVSFCCFAVDDLFGEGSYGKDKYAGARDGCYGKCLMRWFRFSMESHTVLGSCIYFVLKRNFIGFSEIRWGVS